MSLFLVGMLLLGASSAQAFTDIPESHPAYHQVMHLQDIGVFSAYPDGSFRPDQIITRAEAVAIAMRGAHISPEKLETTPTLYFNDLDPNAWYTPYIDRAVDASIVSWKQPNFRPNDPVTRAEFLAYILRATRVDLAPYSYRTTGVAADITSQDWYAPHFAYARKYNIVPLTEQNTFEPGKVVTRLEAAKMIFAQLRMKHGTEETKLFVELQARIEQYMTALRAQNYDTAERQLQEIIELTQTLARTKNSSDAYVARALSLSMENLTDSMRAFRVRNTLSGIERLMLAGKHAERAGQRDSSLAPFVAELQTLISEAMLSLSPRGGTL